MGHLGSAQALLLPVLVLLIFSLHTNGQKSPAKKKETEKEQEVFALPKEVVVIGAGTAGLAAARRLSADKQNFTVRVYEARKDRYGGRVWTDKLTNMKAKGAEVDLGGSSLSVISRDNPLIELAEKFDLKLASVTDLQFIIPWTKEAFSGEDLSEVTHQAAKILGQAMNQSKSEPVEVSVKEAIDKVIATGNIVDANSAAAYLVRCLPSYILDSYSSRNYKPESIDVGYDKVLLDGMGELIDRLVSGSTEEAPLHLSLNKVVRQIKADKDKRKVLVRFCDGSQVAADMVVVAVPLSVIASRELLFEPELPHKYQFASREISTSAGDKVIIEFEQAFWPGEFGVFTRAVQTDADRGNLQTWVNVHRLVGQPVLTGLLVGQPAVDFESLTLEQAKDLVLSVLNEMFGEELVKQGGAIVRFQHSNWVTDNLSLGASTYPKVGSDPGLWDTFSAPLCPYIYFAGEHTSFDGHGTLHGAYNSGLRAGDQIITGLCETLRKEEERRQREERKKKAKENKTIDNKLEGGQDGVDVEDVDAEGVDVEDVNTEGVDVEDVNVEDVNAEDEIVEEVKKSKAEKTEL